MNGNQLPDGPYAILTTPFLNNGNVNYDALAARAEELCRTNITGIIPCGSTGEFISCSFEENAEIFHTLVKTVKGRKRLVGGATAPDVLGTQRILALLADLGYDAALIAPPYYFQHSEEEVTCFYREIGCVELPVVAYQIPAFTSPISKSSYLQLLEMDHIIALKNSSANIKEIMHQLSIKDNLRPSFKIFTGTDDAIFPCIVSGCSGSFTALAAIIPNTICALYKALKTGDQPTALSLQYEIMPLIRLADSFPFPVGYKLLAHANGFEMGTLRQSLPPNMYAQLPKTLQEMRRLLSHLKTEQPLNEIKPLGI